jgi:hypothetical protein
MAFAAQSVHEAGSKKGHLPWARCDIEPIWLSARL